MTQLFSCPACGHACAYDARSCPNCGKPWPAQFKAPLPQRIGEMIYMILVVGFMLGVGVGMVWFFVKHIWPRL